MDRTVYVQDGLRKVGLYTRCCMDSRLYIQGGLWKVGLYTRCCMDIKLYKYRQGYQWIG